MAATFIGSEVSAVRFSNSSEVTTAGTFRSANSRGSIQADSSSESSWAEWDSAVAEGWIHFVFNSSTLDNDGSDNILVVTDSSAANLFRLSASAVNTIQPQYWNGSAWVNAGTSFAHSTTVHEMVVQIVAGASGGFGVYQSGFGASSADVAFPGTDMKRATFYCPDDILPVQYSEIILGDSANSLVGGICETEPPTADGTDTDGTGTYADVDEIPYSDADNLVLASAGEQHSFTSPARTSTQAFVLGVSVAARMKRDVSGPQSAKFYLKIGGLRYYSSTFALTEGYDAYQYNWQENPATVAAWTPSEANDAALEWGIEAVA